MRFDRAELLARVESAHRSGSRKLSLADLGLTEIPREVFSLTNLQALDLKHNRLKSLPVEIAALKELEQLDLSGNQLEELPPSLGTLPNLKQIFLHGNTALGLPEEILGPNWVKAETGRPTRPAREILDYYFSVAQGGLPLREMKVILVGRGGVGKTSLVRRLLGEPFDEKEQETHGIGIKPLNLECEDGPILARTWDFGGQHVLHAMHEFFLTARTLYVLVLGAREDMAERDAVYWLRLIRNYAGPAPVVIALNKAGSRPREIDKQKLEQDYGPILGWVFTECAEPDDEKSGIAALRKALAKATDRMPEVRSLFPSKWLRIKQWLSDSSEAFLPYQDFTERCRQLGESDPAKQEELAAWLHDLGIALNYGRDPRLRDLTVLRPDWLANGIYAVLRAHTDNMDGSLAPRGIISLNTLGDIYAAAARLGILSLAEYPEDKWPFLLRLMSRFQISFPLDDEGRAQLVPALLPVSEPPGAVEPIGPGRVRIRYAFDVLPAPLVPRLLVRTFALISENLLWRRGAIFTYGPAGAKATAKVWSTMDERWVYLTVCGPEETREVLTKLLRASFQRLFAEYKFLTVVEQVEWEESWVPRTALEKLGQVTADSATGVEKVEKAEGKP